MNNSSDQITAARSLIETTKEVIIALPANPTLDAVASSLSLYLGLSVRGISATVVCPTVMTVEFNQLVGVDKIGNNISNSRGKNLVISFPYQEGSIEKVSYNIESNTFNLVIEPREGYPQVTQDMIRFSANGGNIDLIITIGVDRLTDLGQVYNNAQSLFAQKPILNVGTGRENSRFGKVNVVDPNVSSISELMIDLFSNLGITLNADIASNLLAGITSETANFSTPLVQASTYEVAAMCLRNGARKINQSSATPQTIPSFQKPPPPTSRGPLPKTRPFGQTQPLQQSQQQPKKQTNEAPPDWLKPKIYKGSTLL